MIFLLFKNALITLLIGYYFCKGITGTTIAPRIRPVGLRGNVSQFDTELATRFFSLPEMWTSINDFLVLKKNLIAAWPFEIAANAIDFLCSSTLYMQDVPQKITPDIRRMNFHYITACKNYSVPLLAAERLWKLTNFDKSKKVVILATGWTNTVNDSSTLAMLSKAFLCRNDVNFIIVDVAYYVDTLYNWAALNTEEIGDSIAIGLTHLIKLVPIQNIHLIGHSLGAHIMGTAGRTFHKLTGQFVPRITGLDPAKPCFWKNETITGLHRGDAAFVDIIHTNIGILGKRDPIGDIDFYPGGANALPPGCLTIGCAHSRAVEYFTESVYPENEYNFLSFKCSSWEALKRDRCSSNYVTTMGYVVDKEQKGIFHLNVNRVAPFGKQANVVEPVWEKSTCNVCPVEGNAI